MIKKNQKKAIELFAAAAAKGDEYALNFLGAYQFNTMRNIEDGVFKFR